MIAVARTPRQAIHELAIAGAGRAVHGARHRAGLVPPSFPGPRPQPAHRAHGGAVSRGAATGAAHAARAVDRTRHGNPQLEGGQGHAQAQPAGVAWNKSYSSMLTGGLSPAAHGLPPAQRMPSFRASFKTCFVV